jgi:DNA-binding FadR family transcriptional regulator
MHRSLAEHDAIVTAILSQDAAAAGEAMRNHAAHSAMNVMQYVATAGAVRPGAGRGQRIQRPA